ncbi:MAG TPA: hypothetical protein VK738_16735 [Terriglobales bacterium]|jgi:hypothetical protein|nr:hypothetical protein [Terriglobales bacterium]
MICISMPRVSSFALRVVALVLLLGAGVLFSPALHGQARSKRLILKDGSYQSAVRWEVKGDRVRYFSAERYEWEELPTSLIDWPATEKYEQELQEGISAEEKRLAAEDEAERKAQEAKTPVVAPGVQLPDTGGVYLLDVYQERPELVELVQSGGEIHKDMGRTILSAAINPISLSTKQTIEIPGARGRVQAHSTQPVIYLDINESVATDDTAPDANKPDANKSDTKKQKLPDLAQRFRIVQLEKKKDSRVIGNLKIMFYGTMSQQENLISTQVEQVTSEWIKVTPAASLKPGEYAVAEMLAEKQMNLFVWDFGVDPSAPQNPSAWTPVQPKTTPAGTDDTPVLQSRPH